VLFDIPEAHICAVMRVPPIIAGLNVGLQRSTFSNYGEARMAFTQDTMAPLWMMAAGALRAGLADEFGNGVHLRHDLGKVQALQENQNDKWSRVDTALNSGYLSFQETRAALGYADPRPDDLFLHDGELVTWALILNPPPPPTIRVLPPAQLPPPSNEPPPEPMPMDNEPPPKALRQSKAGSSAAKATARKLQRARSQVAKRMEGAVDSFFADLADRVLARVGKAWKPKMCRKDVPGEDELLLADDWLDLATIVKRYYVEVLEASWPAWNSALGVDVAFELTDPAVVAALKNAGSRVADISETTRGFLAQVLQDGADAGLTIGELRDGIRLVIEESYKGRAQSIARSELATAQNLTTAERYDNAGISQVTIFDNGQDDPDEECAAVNGTVQTLTWFRKNLTAHPRCTRCAAPYFED